MICALKQFKIIFTRIIFFVGIWKGKLLVKCPAWDRFFYLRILTR